MAIYRGPGGSGDATGDSANQAQIAQEFAAAASTSATNAANSATTASNAATAAQAAQTAAETAQAAAETAQTAAETAETNAETAQTAAETAQTAAETAQAAAETAETNAASSATDADTFATNASTSASAAATSATNAATSATAAATSATNAETAETAAETAQTAAETAQAAAEAALDSFDDRYLGAKSSDPTLDNDGNALLTGALYWNTASDELRIYSGSAWVAVVDTADIGVTVQAYDADTVKYDDVNPSFTDTGAIKIPAGTAVQRPGTPAAGQLRFNNDSTEFEGYNGTAWSSVGGSAISNDTSTASDLYPIYVDATTGTAANVYTSNAQYLFKPSTGELKVKAPVAANGIVVNAAAMSSDYTIDTGFNGFSVGPFTINGGVTLTIASGQRHVII